MSRLGQMSTSRCECGCGEFTRLATFARNGVNAGEPQRFSRGHNVPPHGERHHLWKENKVSYSRCHGRLVELKGQPQYCEVCGTRDPTKRYEWANLTGDYIDPEDYKRMCVSCHRKHDNAARNLKACGLA